MSNTPKTGETKAAKAAAKAEALDQDISLSFHDRHYVIPRANADDVELFEAIEDEHYITAVRGFLGREQWGDFKDAHRVDGRVPMSALEEFLNALLEAVGNRSASPSS